MMKRTYAIPAVLMAAAALAGCQTTAQNRAQGGQPAMQTASASAPQAQAARAAGAAQASQSAPAPQAQPAATAVDFRLAQTTPADGLAELKVGDGSLWLLATPVLNRGDLASVEPRQTDQGQAYLRIGFNEAGARKLAAISGQYPGKLLALTINNTLIAVPQVRAGMTNGLIDIPFANAEQAVNAARAIAG